MKRTLADKTVYQNGSIDTVFDPPRAQLDSTFKNGGKMILFEQNRKNFICSSIKMSSQRTEGSDMTEVEDSDKSWTPSQMSENMSQSQSQKKGKKKREYHKNYFVNLCSLLMLSSKF